MTRKNWTRNELIVAFNLYCKIPFGKIDHRNKEIIHLANQLGRTPSALAWKLANFARLDPSLQKRRIKGATHGSSSEVEIWNEFHNDWEKLSFESENLLHKKISENLFDDNIENDFPEGRTKERIIRSRVNHDFFRAAVLASYESRCCITGLDEQNLLNASHIVPWSIDVKNRTNPRNGLCLNAIHDRAFDRGLITITTDYEIKLSSILKKLKNSKAKETFFYQYESKKIELPNRFSPAADFLKYHNEHIFIA